MSKGYYYFRMKVKSGNSLFHTCLDIEFNGREQSKPEIEEQAFKRFETDKNHIYYMILGYDYSQDSLVTLGKNGAFAKNSSKHFQCLNGKKSPDDYFWFALVGSEQYRNDSRVLIFGLKYLFIFEPVGEMSGYKGSGRLPSFNNSYKKTLIKQLGSDENNYQKKFHNSAFLPLRLVRVIQRHELMPAINSLSVYQYLNQGAFRPLYACGHKIESSLNFFSKHRVLPRLDITKTDPNAGLYEASLKKDAKKLETTYSVLVRYYLEGRFHEIQKDITEENRIELFCALLSPVQLETAASYYLIDLGFLPDTISGGSMDHIDLIGRKEDSKEVMSLQCKNYDYNQAHVATIFEPLSPHGEDRNKGGNEKVFLNEKIQEWLKNPPANSLLIRWYKIQLKLMSNNGS